MKAPDFSACVSLSFFYKGHWSHFICVNDRDFPNMSQNNHVHSIPGILVAGYHDCFWPWLSGAKLAPPGTAFKPT